MNAIQLTPDNPAERARFLRRLHSIRNTPLFKELRRYRKHINREKEVDQRRAEVGLYKGESGYFSEATDTIPMLHSFLDQHQIPQDP